MAIAFKRGKRKVLADYKLPDIYKYYKEHCKHSKLTRKQFADIIVSFHDRMADKMVWDNIEMFLPHRMGSIYLIKKNNVFFFNEETGKAETKFLKLDFAACKKKWEEMYPGLTGDEIAAIPNKPKIFWLHENTDGKYARWFWDKSMCIVHNKYAYYFEPVRELSQKVARYINTFNRVDYYERR